MRRLAAVTLAALLVAPNVLLAQKRVAGFIEVMPTAKLK